MQEIKTTGHEPMMTIDDVAKRLNCSIRKVNSMKAYGRMPQPVRLGRLVRWDRAVIEKWIAQGCPKQAAAKRKTSWKR